MNHRTTITRRAQTWTAALLAATSMAAATLATPSARAQNQGEGVAPGQAIPAHAPPPLPAPPLAAQPGPTQPAPVRSLHPQEPSAGEEFEPPPSGAPPTITDWRNGEPMPRGDHPVQRPRTGAIVAGAVTFGSLYLISLLVAAGSTDTANQLQQSNPESGLYVPVVGPFIAMTQTSSTAGNMALLIDGLGQATGAVLFVWGLTSPQTLLIRNDYARPRLMPRPMVFGKSGCGLGLAGSF